MSQKDPLVRLGPVNQLGIVVKDLDKAVEFYSAIFGWGPFRTADVNHDVSYKGQVRNCQQRNAFGRCGEIEIELIQPLKGETPHTDFLTAKGEGVEHLRFQVDDLESTLAALARGGIRPVYQGRYPNLSFAYVSSDVVGGVMFELIEWKTDQRPL